MRRLILVAVALIIASPSVLEARVPPSMLKTKEEQVAKSKWRATKKRLKAEGYKKNVFGIDMGYIKDDFVLEPAKVIYVAPIKNMARPETEGLMDALSEATRKKVVQLIEETELFSKVTTKKKDKDKADYSLEIYVMEIETMFNIWASGSRLVWGVNLYDGERNLLMAGYDRISSDAYSRDVRFLVDQMPSRSVLFVCRANPEFNSEFKKLMRTHKIDWKIWN